MDYGVPRRTSFVFKAKRNYARSHFAEHRQHNRRVALSLLAVLRTSHLGLKHAVPSLTRICLCVSFNF
jgi:hypothetical protein